jgi:UPF0271 protein
MLVVDLNCDMGESFGAWKMGNDDALLDHVTSANIACGFHAGDPTTIRKTIELALERKVAVGAHPGYPDLQGFGRRSITMKPDEVFDIVLYQVSAIKGICESLGGHLHHVKPHGALYNQAVSDRDLSAAIARAVAKADPDLVYFGLAGSQMITDAEELGLRTAAEVFADRTYQSDGTLTPRSQPNALIWNIDESIEQVLQMVKSQTVTAVTGEPVPIRAETICIHGDGANALEFAKAIRHALAAADIGVEAK